MTAGIILAAVLGGVALGAISVHWAERNVARLEKDVRASFQDVQADLHETMDRVDAAEKQRIVRFITNGGNA